MSEYANLKNLLQGAASADNLSVSALSDSVQALGDAIKKGRHVGRFGLRVTDKSKVRHYCVDLLGGECKVSETHAEDATFAIACTKETWAKVAGGELSAVDAFYQGQMEVEGDLAFAKRLYANAASKRGTTDLEV